MISQKRAHSVTPLPKRIEAYTYLQQMMKSGHLSRHEMVTTVTGEFGVSQQTVYSWFHGQTPYGERAGRISRRKELLYVLGALLGDGCIYFWKNVYQVWLVGEEEFASRFANKISSCVGRKVSSYPYRGRNVWFVLI